MAIISIAAIILVFGATYLLVIEPNRIVKPDIEKPLLPENALELAEQGQQVITTTHLSYLINEMEGFKLKSTPLSKEPAVIEFYIADTKKYFHTTITDHKPATAAGRAQNPDVRIIGSQETIISILSSDDVLAATQQELDSNTITTKLFKDAKELGLKGYLSIYDLFK